MAAKYDPARQIAEAEAAMAAYQQQKIDAAQKKNAAYNQAVRTANELQKQQTAQNATNTGILNAAYQNSLAANQKQYDTTMAAAKAAYDSSAKRLGAAAQAALQAAYIDRMRAQRDMPQQLATMGINGGMSETAAARLQNNYANNRNAIETARLEQLGALDDSLLQAQYAAQNQLTQLNAADAANYYKQLSAGASAGQTKNTAYNYKTDPAYFAQLALIHKGEEGNDYDTLSANYLALATRYGIDGADALLKVAMNK